jgi:hypothetical protein
MERGYRKVKEKLVNWGVGDLVNSKASTNSPTPELANSSYFAFA